MIIFGWRSRTSVEQSGSFHCPVCNDHRPHMVTRTRPWFTLFFIPVFPVSNGSSNVVCGGCQSVINPSQINLENQTHARQAYSQDAWHPQAAPSNIFAVPTVGPTKHQIPSSTSGAAIASLIFGILSPIFFIVCLTSLLTSLVAIVCGHIALGSIKNSHGRLHGRELAIAGLIFGYLMMSLTIVAIAWIASLDPSSSNTPMYADGSTSGQTAKDRLESAEMMVLSDSQGNVGSGNSDAAKELAIEFSNDMKAISEDAFTEGPKRIIQLSGGNFLTYCELDDDSAAFIVHVPSYRDYEKDAKKVLAELAWQEAVSITSDLLDEGDDLAVALRGTFLYGDIMVGTHPGSNHELNTWRFAKSDDLLPFFQEPIPPNDLLPEIDSDSDFGQLMESTQVDSSNTTAPDSVAAPDSSPENPTFSDPFSPTDTPPTDTPPTAPTVSDFASSARSPKRNDTKPKPKVELPPFENLIPIKLVSSIEAAGWNVQSMTFTGDGRFLVAGRLDQTISVFNVASQQCVYQSERIEDLGQIASLAITRDNQHVIAAGYTGATKLMNIDESGALTEVKSLFNFSGEVKCLETSRVFDFVLGGDRKGTLAWQPYDDRSLSARTINGLQRPVLAAHLPVEGQIAMATDGQKLIHFSLSDGKIVNDYDLKSGSTHAAAFDHSGAQLAVSHGSEIRQYASETGTLSQTYKAESGGAIGGGIQWTVAYHPNQPWLVSGGSKAATVWDQETGQRLAVLDSGATLYIQTLAISTDGKKIAIVPAAAGQSIKVFQFTDL